MPGIFLIDTFLDKIVENNTHEKKNGCQNGSGKYKQFGCFIHKYGNLLPRWCFSCWFSGFLLMFLGLRECKVRSNLVSEGSKYLLTPIS